MLDQKEISKVKVEEDQMTEAIASYFGFKAHVVEINTYAMLDMLSPDYHGGSWNFYKLSNDGFYMAPSEKKSYRIRCNGNEYDGTMTSDAAGITACLFALSHLSFEPRFNFLAEFYEKLYEFACEHEESEAILAAID